MFLLAGVRQALQMRQVSLMAGIKLHTSGPQPPADPPPADPPRRCSIPRSLRGRAPGALGSGVGRMSSDHRMALTTMQPRKLGIADTESRSSIFNDETAKLFTIS